MKMVSGGAAAAVQTAWPLGAAERRETEKERRDLLDCSRGSLGGQQESIPMGRKGGG